MILWVLKVTEETYWFNTEQSFNALWIICAITTQANIQLNHSMRYQMSLKKCYLK